MTNGMPFPGIGFATIHIETPSGEKRPFRFRQQSAGDRGVIEQVFANNDYTTAQFPLANSLLAFYERTERPLIIDLGANIGASVVFFAEQWPKALIVAVEPEPHNFYLLSMNTAHLQTVKPRRAACLQAAANNGLATFVTDPGRSDWGFRTQHVAPDRRAPAVPGIRPRELLAVHSDTTPFIAKIDIEGGEHELFENSIDNSWLERFALVVIETHDWMLPGQATSRSFLRAISALNFDIIARGENWWCFNNDLLGAHDTAKE